MMSWKTLAIVCLTAAIYWHVAAARAATRYKLEPLPAIADEVEAVAAGINNLQQVVGHVLDEQGHRHAALWSPQGAKLLPELSMAAPFSQAARINNCGQIVGRAGTAEGAVHATLWENGQVFDLGTLSGGGDSFAADINENGVVAGSSDAEVGAHAFTWTLDEGFVDYGNTNPPFRLAVAGFNGLNNHGLLVGTSYILLSPYRAAFAREGDSGLTDLSPAGRQSLGMALAVNDAGTIVGYQSDSEGRVQATIFEADGSLMYLGALGLEESWALDVNQSDMVVGRAFSFGVGGVLIPKAFLYDEGTMHDLLELSNNPEDWTLVEATGVNNHGVIVGNGLLDGKPRAFVATPVPEPVGVVLCSLSIALASAFRRQLIAAGQPCTAAANDGATSLLQTPRSAVYARRSSRARSIRRFFVEMARP